MKKVLSFEPTTFYVLIQDGAAEEPFTTRSLLEEHIKRAKRIRAKQVSFLHLIHLKTLTIILIKFLVTGPKNCNLSNLWSEGAVLIVVCRIVGVCFNVYNFKFSYCSSLGCLVSILPLNLTHLAKATLLPRKH